MKCEDQESHNLLFCAYELAKGITRPLSMVRQFVKVAIQYGKNEDAKTSDSILKHALSATENAKGVDKALSIAEVAYGYAELGQRKVAEDLFSRALFESEKQPEIQKYGVLYRIAELYCNLFWYESASQLTEGISEGVYKSTIRSVIVEKYIQIGDLDSALKEASRMKDGFVFMSEIALKLTAKNCITGQESGIIQELKSRVKDRGQ